MTKQEALQKIEELKKFVEDSEKEERQDKFVPEYGETAYFFSMGEYKAYTSDKEWDYGFTSVKNLIKYGLVAPTEEEMKNILIRLEAMSSRWLPKEGEDYWYWDIDDQEPLKSTWYNYHVDSTDFWLGNCHRTQEEAQAWGEKYGKAFELPRK